MPPVRATLDARLRPPSLGGAPLPWRALALRWLVWRVGGFLGVVAILSLLAVPYALLVPPQISCIGYAVGGFGYCPVRYGILP